MWESLLINFNELFVLIAAETLLFILYTRFHYSLKEKLIWCLILLPFLYCSINKLTEIVTVDEPQYEALITSAFEIKNGAAGPKLLYQYRLSQLTTGSVFLVINVLFSNLSWKTTWEIYKICHYIICYLVCFGIVSVWHKRILTNNKNTIKERIAENAILITLVSLPVGCLMFKVANYDALSAYPAILGMSLLWASYKTENRKLAFIGTAIVALGTLEKMTLLPQWCICVALSMFIVGRGKEKLGKKIGSGLVVGVISLVIALLLSLISLLLMYVQQNGLMRQIDIDLVASPFTRAMNAVKKFAALGNTITSSIGLLSILLVLVLSFGTVLICIAHVFETRKDQNRKRILTAFKYILAILFIISIIGGVIVAYNTPLKTSHDLLADESYWGKVEGALNSFGTKTKIGFYFASYFYTIATIITNAPTVVTLLMCVSIVLFATRKEIEAFPIFFIVVAGLLLLMYSVTGLEYDARYYASEILITLLCGIWILYNTLDYTTTKKVTAVAMAGIFQVEMILYCPNIKPFSPLWLVRDEVFKNSINSGLWYAGEAMPWGEELALAGNLISDDIEGNGEAFSDYTIYWNYNGTWISNPGITIAEWGGIDTLKVHDSYVVLSKFRLFRNSVPEYVKEVTPWKTLTYRGETAAWIYKGEQLMDYMNHKTEEK